MKKRIFGVVLACSMFITMFAGCGNKNEVTNSTNNAAISAETSTGVSADEIAKKIDGYTVKVATFWAPHEIELGNKWFAENYTPKTGSKVEMEFTSSSGEYNQKVISQIAAGSPPDVILFNDNSIAPFMEKSLLLPLDEYTKRDNFKAEEFFAIGDWKVNGQLIGIPNLNTVPYFFVNKDMFKDAGIEVPTGDWTFDQLLAAAQKLTKKDDAGNTSVWGFVNACWWSNEWWYNLNGGKTFTDDDTKCTIDDPKVVTAMQFMSDMITKYKVHPEYSAFSTTPADQLFLEGKAAIMYGGPWETGYLRSQNATINWDVVLPPKGPDAGDKYVPSASAGIAIPKNVKNPEASWQLLKYWGSAEGTNGINIKGITTLPSTNETIAAEAYKDQKPEGLNKDFLAKLVDRTFSVTHTRTIYSQNFANYTGLANSIWNEQKSAEPILNDIAAKINAEISTIKKLEK